MKQIITDAIIEEVSTLAQLELNEEERRTAASDMEKMLVYIDMLNELNTDGIEPMSHITNNENSFREDIVTASSNPAALLEGAPAVSEDYYVVPLSII